MPAQWQPESKTDLRGKKATLIGLGARTHVALARFLVQCGVEVTISDAKPAEKLTLEIGLLGSLPVKLSLGGHFPEDILGADIVFVTPGASRDLPVLQEAAARGIPLSSEIELLFSLCPASICAITGSSGKTTTTTLVGEMLMSDGRRTFVGGNIGTPLIEQLDDMRPEHWVVLELSSFQLEHMKQSPRVAAVLNITPNHLDRHGTMENYVAAKKNIVLHQKPTDWAVLGADDPQAYGLAADCPGRVALFSARREVDKGAWLRGGTIVLRLDGVEAEVCERRDIRLLGDHNVLNALAATAIGAAAGVDVQSIRRVITSFRGVEHRLELVREHRGARFYNDSIATSPERTIAALRSFDQPIVLIAGGKSKHLPLDALAERIVAAVRFLILMGELGEEIENAVRATPGGEAIPIVRCSSLQQAVSKAAEVAEPGDVVLLSPGGTSFDFFRDFEDRGRQFKAMVSAL